MAPKIAISGLICYYPMMVNMTRGLRDVAPEQMELMRVLCATPREIFTQVRLQNSIPYMFAALKVTASTSVIGAVVGEWVGATQGLGAVIIDSTVHYESPMLYAAVVVGSAFSAVFFFLVTSLEKFLLKWKVERDG
jgi:NitT/TauT family transport system permease protein